MVDPSTYKERLTLKDTCDLNRSDALDKTMDETMVKFEHDIPTYNSKQSSTNDKMFELKMRIERLADKN